MQFIDLIKIMQTINS